MTTVLVTLGRLPKALELVRALAAAGCRVIVAEPFRWHICRLSRAVKRSYRVPAPNGADLSGYQAALIRIINDEEVDVVVPVSEEAIHALSIQPLLTRPVKFFSPPLDLVMQLHDKLRFARLAEELGLDVPPTELLGDPAAESIAEQSDYVVKPAHSCSGIGLQIRHRGQPLPESKGVEVVQAFLDGDHISTFTVAHEGQIQRTVMYRGTVFTGTVAVCFERVDELGCVTDWVQQFVSRTGLSGFICFDFIVKNGTARAIECNPRLTSGVHFLEPDGLADAVLYPGRAADLPLRDERLFQLFYSTLTETQRQVRNPVKRRHHFRQLRQARDVVWSWADPLPFLLMTPACYEILYLTIFKGRTFGEAATEDIAWFGESS